MFSLHVMGRTADGGPLFRGAKTRAAPEFHNRDKLPEILPIGTPDDRISKVNLKEDTLDVQVNVNVV
jgi:hypothetical protein